MIYVILVYRFRPHYGDGGKERDMLDALLLVAGVAFFAIAIAYVAACDQL